MIHRLGVGSPRMEAEPKLFVLEDSVALRFTRILRETAIQIPFRSAEAAVYWDHTSHRWFQIPFAIYIRPTSQAYACKL